MVGLQVVTEFIVTSVRTKFSVKISFKSIRGNFDFFQLPLLNRLPRVLSKLLIGLLQRFKLPIS